LIPDCGIALDLNVGFHENAVPPRILAAAERFCLVVGTKIPKDARARRIGSANLSLAVEHAIELIEIDSLADVRGDDGVILPLLGDAIDLDGENYRDTVFFQLACEFDRF